MIRKFLALTVVCALGCVSAVNSAEAKEPEDVEQTPVAEHCAPKENYSAFSAATEQKEDEVDTQLVEGGEAETLKTQTLAFVASGDIELQSPESALTEDETNVYTIETEEQAFRSVTVPIGDGHLTPSNVTVLFGEAGEMVSYSETIAEENDSGIVSLENYANGELAHSDAIDSGAAEVPDMEQSDDSQLLLGEVADKNIVAYKSKGEIAACVAVVLGVSGTVGYLIAGLCAGACTIPIGGTPICVACIGAYASIGGISIKEAAGCF